MIIIGEKINASIPGIKEAIKAHDEDSLKQIAWMQEEAGAQVIDVNGQVVRRLYAGGMNAGGFLGPYYPGSGTALNSTVTFGRIAGRNAVGEQRWA